MERQSQEVIRPKLNTPLTELDPSILPAPQAYKQSKMVRGEMLYKTPTTMKGE